MDFGIKDKEIIAYALRLAQADSELVLIHVVESASASIIGEESLDQEAQEDANIMQRYDDFFRAQGFHCQQRMAYGNRIKAITRIVAEEQIDLLIVGSHGHHKLRDILFGETVNTLRHKVKIPVFIAQ